MFADRVLRASGKVLPEHARSHNRSLVLQTLYTQGAQSRADLARETALTRVTDARAPEAKPPTERIENLPPAEAAAKIADWLAARKLI